MQIKIHLSKKNKYLLKKMVLDIFPEIKRIKFKGDIVIVRKGLLKRSIKIELVKFILNDIPSQLNELSSHLGQGEVYPTFLSRSESLSYFSNCEDIVKELYSQYSDIKLSDVIEDDFIEIEESSITKRVIIESEKTKQLFLNNVENYKRRIDEVIPRSISESKVIHISRNQASRAPPVTSLHYANVA